MPTRLKLTRELYYHIPAADCGRRGDCFSQRLLDKVHQLHTPVCRVAALVHLPAVSRYSRPVFLLPSIFLRAE